MELHIWGPAFGLPSIDPECLAAIAYFRCIPELNPHRTDSGGIRLWTIVPSSNPLLSPTRTLPALRDNGIWVGGGFNGIIDYLRTKSKGLWDLDRDLRHPGDDFDSYNYEDGQDSAHSPGPISVTYAESIAYSSFIRSRLGPLLDISLYVSDVNYSNKTRPEYSKSGMLPWPVQYYVPGQKRAEVWERCEEVLRKFGLAAKDVDPIPLLDSFGKNSGVDVNATSAGTSGNAIGEGVGIGGISSIFGRKPSASTAGVVFKLQTLISKSLTPVAARLVAADSDPSLGVYFFKGQAPTSIDCLILGYVCLAIYPELPNPFLAEGINELDGGRGGKRVCAWVHEFRRKTFGSMPIDGNRVLNPEDQESDQNQSHEDIKKYNKNDNSILPWGKLEKADLPWLTGQFLFSAGDYLNSYLPASLTAKRLFGAQKPESNPPPEGTASENLHKAAKRRENFAKIATVFVGVGAFLAFLVSSGIISVVSIEVSEEGKENKEHEGDIVIGNDDVEEELEHLEKEEISREERQNRNDRESQRSKEGERVGVDVDQGTMMMDITNLGSFDPPASPPPPPPPDTETNTSQGQAHSDSSRPE